MYCHLTHMTANMAAIVNTGMKFVLVFAIFTLVESQTPAWPVPYGTVKSRPASNPYCQAGVLPFCPTGRTPNAMPTFNKNDTLYVYAMKAPVWEFKFGSLLEKYNIMHDAMGFHHVESGANFTMEWYELFQLFNCTFPHLLNNDTLLWCNQGAACIYDGIDEMHWKQNGTLVKIAEITGDAFNKFANWTEQDNNTAVFYETWTVKESPEGQIWFNAWECASWVLRALDQLGKLDAKFNHSVHLNYTRMNLYASQPMYLGNASAIFNNATNKKLAEDMTKFYHRFQSHQSMPHLVESLVESFLEVVIEGKFYLFYNEEYWQLDTHYPFFKITYNEVPLPGAP